MSIVARVSPLSSRFALCSAIIFTAILGSRVEAQSTATPPQLLPYTSKLIAGGDPTATFKVGQVCPQAGGTNVAADTLGDGCLATEINFGTGTAGPRYAIADSLGNVFISDYTNGLVRRVDVITGIITAVAGGGATLAKNAICGTLTSSDALGDGCLGTAVKLGKPAGLAFDKAGDLIFADSFNYSIRMIAATNGFVPAAGGVISLIAGANGGTTLTGGFTSGVNAANASYVEDVYGISFDTINGNLFFADEYSKAEDVSVINLNPATSTNPDVVTGITIPTGQTVKIAGATKSNGPCLNYPTTGFGCTFGTFANNNTALATVTQLDAPYAVANDASGNVYIANEFQNSVAKISSSGVLTLFAGINTGSGSSTLPNTTRALATSVDMGTDFGVAADPTGNVYITDSYLGYVWRVDASTGYMYVVAGGGSGSCANPNPLDTPASYDTADTFGDGCPALQAKLGVGTRSAGYNSSGVFGVTLDAYGNLFLGDDNTNIVREIATGAQFGVVGANQPTNMLEIHFGPGDTPASTSPFILTAGATNFSLGTPHCSFNSADTTTDCLLPVTATPSVLGVFKGTLQVTSTLGGTTNAASFALSGTYAQSPTTRTSLSYVAGVTCTGTTVYATTTSITLTATVTANGPAPPVGPLDMITFYANNGTTNTAIGTAPVINLGTAGAPVYGATLTYTFATPATYTLTAIYSGDQYFQTSTGTAGSTITSSTPAFTVTAGPSEGSIVQGQTALFSFNVNQSVYTGTITFAVTGLPPGASFSISQPSVTAAGCSATTTVTLNVLTTGLPPSNVASIGGNGHGPFALLSLFCGLATALAIGLQCRRLGSRLAQFGLVLALLAATSGLVACNTVTLNSPAATPKGTYTVTVTSTGSTGGSVTTPLTVVVN